MKKPLYLISGASSGIGAAIVTELTKSGAQVLGIGRNEKRLIDLQNVVGKENFIFEKRDLLHDTENLDKWVRSLSQQYGAFSGFVHSAGIQKTIPLKTYQYHDFKQIFDLNVLSGLLVAKGVCHKTCNIGIGTSVVFISSISANKGVAGLVGYSATKAAVNGAMRSLAKEVARKGIRVNSILPGFVMTEMITQLSSTYDENFLEKQKKNYPLGIGEPQDIAKLTRFLLSNEAKWITGSEITIDGGCGL